MPAQLKLPFAESCCDGGATSGQDSCQPCGCDPKEGWVCERHRETAMVDTVPAMGWAERMVSGDTRPQEHVPEVRIVDPQTGGAKGQKLARFDLIPPEAEWALSELYGSGSVKYDDRNWEKGYSWGLSYGALRRHLNQWQRGESYDAETKTHHLIAVVWHAIALFVFEVRGLGRDDVRQKRA